MEEKVSMRLKMPHKRGSIMTTQVSAAGKDAGLQALQKAHASGMQNTKDDDVVFK